MPKIEEALSDDVKRLMAQSYKPSTLAHRAARSARVREREFVEPTKIDVDGVAWFALRTVHGCERRVTDELNEAGYRAYCPLGKKRVFYQQGKRSRRSVLRQCPVFTRYIFAGCYPDLPLGKRSVEKIEAILGDRNGALRIPPIVIARINDLELAGEWDDDKDWSEKTIFKEGEQVRIAHSPFAGFSAVFKKRTAEERIKVLVDIFGRLTPVTLDPCQVEKI